jgi:hypothetical protein
MINWKDWFLAAMATLALLMVVNNAAAQGVPPAVQVMRLDLQIKIVPKVDGLCVNNKSHLIDYCTQMDNIVDKQEIRATDIVNAYIIDAPLPTFLIASYTLSNPRTAFSPKEQEMYSKLNFFSTEHNTPEALMKRAKTKLTLRQDRFPFVATERELDIRLTRIEARLKELSARP